MMKKGNKFKLIGRREVFTVVGIVQGALGPMAIGQSGKHETGVLLAHQGYTWEKVSNNEVTL